MSWLLTLEKAQTSHFGVKLKPLVLCEICVQTLCPCEEPAEPPGSASAPRLEAKAQGLGGTDRTKGTHGTNPGLSCASGVSLQWVMAGTLRLTTWELIKILVSGLSSF